MRNLLLKLHLIQSGTHALTNISSTSLPWIIDSDAIEHMTRMKHLVCSYYDPKSINSVRIANGSHLVLRDRVFYYTVPLNSTLPTPEILLIFYILVV